MAYYLTFGYYGKEIGRMTGSTNIKNNKEPTFSIEKIINFFKLENEKCIIYLDLSLVWQGSQSNEKEEIKKIWGDIVLNNWKWKDLKIKLLHLLKLGKNLPVVFKITYSGIIIDIIDCENTIDVVCWNLDKLNELKILIEKEYKERISPYGRIGSSDELTIGKVRKGYF